MVKTSYRKREDPTTGTGVSVSMRREAKGYTSGRNTGQNEKVKGKDQVQGHGALSLVQGAAEPGYGRTPQGCPAWPDPTASIPDQIR